ncbi:hypothetical protein RVV79_004603 [Burkholderia contaminans]|nr:hypothetical protein [Burkholderia contaminans]
MAIYFSEIIDALLQSNGDNSGRLIRGECGDKSQLEDRGYDVVGEVSDFHLYEKYINVNHGDREINSLYKLYYLGENYVGSSVDFGRGVGLMALLKRICDGVQFGPLKGDVHLYFSDDKKDGAILLGQHSVIRFARRSVRSGYAVLGVDYATVGYGKLITGGVVAAMDRLDEKPSGSLRKYSSEYEKLINLCFG